MGQSHSDYVREQAERAELAEQLEALGRGDTYSSEEEEEEAEEPPTQSARKRITIEFEDGCSHIYDAAQLSRYEGKQLAL